LYDSWSTTAPIVSQGSASVVYLGGTFATPGDIEMHAGGQMQLIGTMNNAGQTLNVDTSDGSFSVVNGAIIGGDLRGPAGSVIGVTGELDGVTADIDLTFGTGHIADGLTLNGTATVYPGYRIIFDPTPSGMQSLDGTGTVVMNRDRFGNIGILNIDGDTTLTVSGGITIRGGGGSIGGSYAVHGVNILINTGLISGDVQNGSLSITPTAFTNNGTVEARNGGTLDVSNATNFSSGTLTGGTWQVFANSTLELNSTGIVTNDATILLDGANANLLQSNGTSALDGFATNDTAGIFIIQDGCTFASAGAFSNAGSLVVGASSTLTVSGDYIQTSSGMFTTQIAGPPASGQFGQINITGNAALDGTLDIVLTNGFLPSEGDTFRIMMFASSTGMFATINGLTIGGGLVFTPNYNPMDFTLTVTPG
jgi:hypothetical protein